MFGTEIKLAKIKGIEIVLDISWFWIFILVALSFYFSVESLSFNTLTRVSLSVIASLLLFISALLHELSHALIAKRYGMPTRKITLFLFGGVSNITAEPKTPSAELNIALIGPISSILIGLIFIAFYYIFAEYEPLKWLFINLSYLNFMLAIFNSLPAYPLDGGRIFRSIIWKKIGNLNNATELAAVTGKIVAGGMVVWGVIQFLLLGIISGLWLAFIGVFIYRLAASSPMQTRIMKKIQGVRVKDIYRHYPHYYLGKNIEKIMNETQDGLYDYVILSEENIRIGILPVELLTKEDSIILGGVIPLNKLKAVDTGDDLLKALDLLERSEYPVIRILKNNEFVGIISINDILYFVRAA